MYAHAVRARVCVWETKVHLKQMQPFYIMFTVLHAILFIIFVILRRKKYKAHEYLLTFDLCGVLFVLLCLVGCLFSTTKCGIEHLNY